MNTARDDILRRVRAALHTVPASEQPADIAVTRSYRQTDPAPQHEIVEQFIEYTLDYKAAVHRIDEQEVRDRITRSCTARGVRRLVVPPDLPDAWLPDGVEVLRDRGLSYADLEASDGVLTGCALAIAQTGTIVLDGGTRQGRRVLSLLPDYHLCVVYASQIVGIVPEAVARLIDTGSSTGRPITFISGPSATSDIELNRVEGVHGPRTLEVLVVEQEMQQL
jgi:L-lactate dehydrogenase complex protein LldG